VISVEEARRAVLDPIRRLEAEEVDLIDALGRVLAEDVSSDIDVAPFDNSAMDGYAVRAADVGDAAEDAPVVLDVLEHIPAGSVPKAEVGAGQTSRIMTGAPMPSGADAVVMVEYTRGLESEGGAGGTVEIARSVREGENVRMRGEDMREGDRVLVAGEVVGPAAIGLLAAVGRPRVRVHRRPRVAIVSTGDELVGIEERPGPGRIRNTNAWSLSAQILGAGGEPERLGIARDTEEETRALLGRAGEFDVMLATGGVSMGDFDVVRDVLESMGELSFWKVAMRPGAPLTYGLLGETPFFGLPGNPTSSMVSFELFARPALRIMQGFADVERPTVEARLSHDVKKKPHRRYYLRGNLTRDDGGYVVKLSGSQSSALLTSMHRSNCLLVLPEGQDLFAEGSIVTCMRLDQQEGTP
jgi:molybdopterin molybdotransferase